MNSIKYIIPVAVLGLFLCATTKAREKEVQFTTVPEVVRTTVFHKYHITSPEKVVRVVEEPDNIYELTVLTDSGQQIVYVNADGTIVERPGGVVETTKGESDSGEVTITLDEVQSAGERYEFVQDQGPDAIFIDHQTNKRVIVKGGAGRGPRGGVRTKEGSQTDVQTDERTTEKNKTDVRTNEENKGAVRTEERDQQSGNIREKTDQGNADQGQRNVRNEQRNADQDQKNMKEGEKTQNRSTQGEQREQGNRESTASGNDQQEKNAPQRSVNNGEQQGQKQQRETNRTAGEQQSQEKSKGKAKASPTP
jgi:hypothetical protein